MLGDVVGAFDAGQDPAAAIPRRGMAEQAVAVNDPDTGARPLPAGGPGAAAEGSRVQSVVAWRVILLTLLGREVPGCAAEVLFAGGELEFLGACAEQHGMPGPSDLGAAVALVAQLGAYRERKHDPAPGNPIMWEGYNGLTEATMGYGL